MAGEIEVNFLHVELQAILSMYVGESEHNLHDIFAKVRENRPCVVFFDELDALGGSRHLMRQHHDRMLVNQLLLELDGLEKQNDNVFVIGATNTPWYLDSALRRPGGKPVESLNLSVIADMTKFFFGADLEQVVQDAVEMAMERTFAGLHEAARNQVNRSGESGRTPE